eukprot:Plantae.Rhodophyta-Palmaria_palmata.ctg184.p1 GENE.Plantae.Rhodophyta-Palmaria_palmata.ctg184~~Plantae.Rhodophyta-Palmaria_palmata.ctg184.p1  ORF type:complete len:101 (+),score=7.03 Plantae.Rhodophyta-Palmaria_palmata.ctg184:447-749(+)
MTKGTNGLRKMWTKLKARIALTFETAHITVSTNLANKKLEQGINIVTFMSELDGMYDRLEVMGETISDRSKIAELLTRLPKEYVAVEAALRTLQSTDART